MLSNNQIHEALLPFGVQADEALAGAIRQYMDLLLRWNAKISLTSITKPSEIIERHFGESLFAINAAGIRGGRLADVGAGAGFPGLPLKIALPGLELTLIESNHRKSAFLAEVVRTLGLSGVRILAKRVADIVWEDPGADFVVSRALGSYEELMQWASKSLSADGRVVLWLGLRGSESLLALSGWSWEKPIPLPLSQERVLLVGRPRRP
ncbi:MAG TPA: 16S rRNA (guanine(527)-N(7))-methyltransferase RsmG [Candidatus Acidoferrales bacterium]|jgi:16S rRNA (guanine527-N7)-methyltransferase|nr:16S rRNA (guanine(527)-N(7))-methyltransferase RsmG [Candidatus Acidoferrales bacterium]